MGVVQTFSGFTGWKWKFGVIFYFLIQIFPAVREVASGPRLSDLSCHFPSSPCNFHKSA